MGQEGLWWELGGGGDLVKGGTGLGSSMRKGFATVYESSAITEVNLFGVQYVCVREDKSSYTHTHTQFLTTC